MKCCSACKTEKQEADFYPDARYRDGLRPACKACRNVTRRARYARDPEPFRVANAQSRDRHVDTWVATNRRKYRANRRAVRDERLRRYYGITLNEYEQMLAEQGGVCAICGRHNPDGKAMPVDHSHAHGYVRGLLCTPCNTALGLLGESPGRIRALLSYIERHARQNLRIG